MDLLNEANILEYLASVGELGEGPAVVQRLAGGVSNVVLRVKTEARDMVIKQALPRLNVAAEWYAKVERLHTEVECLRLLEVCLPPGSVPRVFFFDPARHVYAMSTVPERFGMWKAHLLNGRIDPDAVRAAAAALARIHTWTAERAEVRERFGDLEAFRQLRVDPYYCTVQERHPEVAEAIGRVASWVGRECHCLVHGDYSPKNIMVAGGEMVLLDFEVAHWGDPAFDVAFMINHLLLKAVYRRAQAPAFLQAARQFWKAYEEAVRDAGSGLTSGLEERVVGHLACVHLARVDGKSPVEYLQSDEERDIVRAFAKDLLREPPDGVEAAVARYGRVLPASDT